MSKREYTREMLPHTRREVFFDVVKLQWKSLFGLGVVLCVVALPLLFCYIAEQVYSSMILDQANNIENTEKYMTVVNEINGLSNFFAFVEIPIWALIGIAVAGVHRIVRQYAYEECVKFSYDFSKGVKQNARQVVLLFVLYAAVAAISDFAYDLNILTEGVMKIISAVPMALLIFLFTPIAATMLVLIPVYSNSFRKNFMWAFYVFAIKPFKILIACFCAVSVLILALIPHFYIALIGRVIGILLLPFAMLGFYLAMFDILDELINKENYPEIVGKGMF